MWKNVDMTKQPEMKVSRLQNDPVKKKRFSAPRIV